MSFLSGGSWTSDPRRRDDGSRLVQYRRATRSDRLTEASLACVRCDAPIVVGPGRRVVEDELECPFCGHRAPIRDLLSFARPTRPARVILRVGFGGVR